jgi:hypothetical protein
MKTVVCVLLTSNFLVCAEQNEGGGSWKMTTRVYDLL